MWGLKQALPFHPKKPQLAALIVHRVSTELADGTWDGHALKRFYYKKKASQLCSPTSQNHKITRVGRDPHGSSSPTPVLHRTSPRTPPRCNKCCDSRPTKHSSTHRFGWKQLFLKGWSRTCPALPSRGSHTCWRMQWKPGREGSSPMLSPTAEHIEWHVLKCKPDIFLEDFVRHITLLYYYRELSKQPGGKALPQTCTSINCHSIK